MIDIHSHILPGIDDGAKTLSHSLDVIKEAVNNGVTDIIATPHYVNETIYVSPRVENVKLLAKLRAAVKAEGIPVNLYLGNEIYIDNNIPELLKTKKVSTLYDSEYLLVEIPLNEEFPNYEEHFKDLISRGYKVILAHPERYAIIQKDYEIAKNLRKIGVLFQCNLGSLSGKYGKKEKKLVRRLAKDKMVFTFASDIHHCRGDKDWQKSFKKMTKLYNETEIKQLLIGNPRKILTTSCK
ncbi:hypothetical protein IKW73_01925 [Candidatus Saccharibacteria bacterium]|nr:hypothetical protein [Candidatus Saccharibacteria bacterium]